MDQRKRASTKAGSSKKQRKSDVLTKESFMRKIEKQKLYTEGDEYYEKAKINVGKLIIKWT